MHLTNSQLLEPSNVEMEHIFECKHCKMKFDNTLTIRKRLNSVLVEEQRELPSVSWVEFNVEFEKNVRDQVSFIELKSPKKMTGYRKPLIFTAIAASLIVLFGLQFTNTSLEIEGLNNKQIIASLIKENQRLTSELSAIKKNVHSINENKVFLEIELAQIDMELQKLYLGSDNDQNKIKLWKQRQKLIKQLLAANNQSDLIRI